MAAITSPDYPGERLIVCRNPDLARERTPQARGPAGGDRSAISPSSQRPFGAPRKPLRGEAEIALKVGAVVNRHKMAKHFELIHRRRRASRSIARPRRSPPRRRWTASTSCAPTCPSKLLDDAATVGAYKSLARVERAFRSLKTVDLQSASDLPLDDAARARPRLPVHARLSRRAAHARQACADALRRDRSRGRRRHAHQHRRQGRALRSRQAQADHRPHRRRPAGAQLPKPARRPRHYARNQATTALNPNTSSPSTPGQLRSSSKPSICSPSSPDRTQ